MNYEMNKEALAIVRQMISDGQISQEVAEKYFPELVESEDERIRKAIIKYIKTGTYHKSWIDWLEKQGNNAGISEVTKQKLEDNLNKALEKETPESWNEFLEKQGEQKVSVVDFKANDWYVSKVDGKIHNAKFMEKSTNQARKLEIEKAAMSVTGIIEQEEWFIKGAEWSDKNPYISSEKQGEQKQVEFANGDDYGIDGLWHAINILEKTLGKVEGYQTDDGILEHECAITAVAAAKADQKPVEWSEEDKDFMYATLSNLTELKDRYGEEYGKVGKCIDWVKSLKGRVQPKQEWSEEDKAILEKCIGAVKVSCYSYSFKSEAENWLKHLKERYAWKPSELQIEALESATENCAYSEYQNCLQELLEQLKAL